MLVLGLPALVAVIEPADGDTRRSYVIMLGASLVLIALCFFGPLHYWHAAVLLALFALMMTDMVRQGRAAPADDIDPDATRMPGWKMGLYLVVGIVGLPLGAQLLIDGAVGISRALGISEEVIGLTMVALGTSLPELATTFMAALKRETDVAMGNVIGSNLFNILSIMGIASLFGPIPIDRAFLVRDLWVMLACALVLAPFAMRDWRVTRVWGVLFVLAYVGYTVLLFRSGAA
jgi:cation:H+ antiporter